VQGGLRNTAVQVEIGTECAHCGERLDIELDSDLNLKIKQSSAQPYVFAPIVDFEKLAAPTIIDDF
jgi:hypothetical protein